VIGRKRAIADQRHSDVIRRLAATRSTLHRVETATERVAKALSVAGDGPVIIVQAPSDVTHADLIAVQRDIDRMVANLNTSRSARPQTADREPSAVAAPGAVRAQADPSHPVAAPPRGPGARRVGHPDIRLTAADALIALEVLSTVADSRLGPICRRLNQALALTTSGDEPGNPAAQGDSAAETGDAPDSTSGAPRQTAPTTTKEQLNAGDTAYAKALAIVAVADELASAVHQLKRLANLQEQSVQLTRELYRGAPSFGGGR